MPTGSSPGHSEERSVDMTLPLRKNIGHIHAGLQLVNRLEIMCEYQCYLYCASYSTLYNSVGRVVVQVRRIECLCSNM